jgi:hypothetical protein
VRAPLFCWTGALVLMLLMMMMSGCLSSLSMYANSYISESGTVAYLRQRIAQSLKS